MEKISVCHFVFLKSQISFSKTVFYGSLYLCIYIYSISHSRKLSGIGAKLIQNFKLSALYRLEKLNETVRSQAYVSEFQDCLRSPAFSSQPGAYFLQKTVRLRTLSCRIALKTQTEAASALKMKFIVDKGHFEKVHYMKQLSNSCLAVNDVREHMQALLEFNGIKQPCARFVWLPRKIEALSTVIQQSNTLYCTSIHFNCKFGLTEHISSDQKCSLKRKCSVY